jgi:hypothetical protein
MPTKQLTVTAEQINAVVSTGILNSAYRIAFYAILLSTPILHLTAETLTAITDSAINGLSYSTNNGSTWTTYTVPIAMSANTESLWRVESFNSGYTQGCLTLTIS